METSTIDPKSGKICYVTTGATASFPALIKASLAPESIRELVAQGYTHLVIQYGDAKGRAVFQEESKRAIEALSAEVKSSETSLVIHGYDFLKGGLLKEFAMTRESGGLVISHAGMIAILLVVGLRHIHLCFQYLCG